MADTKLTDLSNLASPNATDLLYGVANPAILPLSSKVTIGALVTAVGLTWSTADSRIRTSSAGTAALPALSHAADPNTGIYFVAPDILLFSTAGMSRGQIIANGRWSVGTLAPAAQMHVAQEAAAGAIPCVALDQDDADQPFMLFDGTIAADATASISTLGTPGAITHWAQVTVSGGVGKRWIALYADPS